MCFLYCIYITTGVTLKVSLFVCSLLGCIFGAVALRDSPPIVLDVDQRTDVVFVVEIIIHVALEAHGVYTHLIHDTFPQI